MATTIYMMVVIKVVSRLSNFDTTLAQLSDHFWDNFVTTIEKVVTATMIWAMVVLIKVVSRSSNFDTTFGSLWDYFETILG